MSASLAQKRMHQCSIAALMLALAMPLTTMAEEKPQAAQQDMTQAEARRLEILRAEKKQALLDLVEESENYTKADDENKKIIGKRIQTIQNNLRDLDVEIKETGKMPEIKAGGEAFQAKSSKQPKQKEEAKDAGKPKHESWDVFGNF